MKKATMSVLSMVLLSACAGIRTQQSQDPCDNVQISSTVTTDGVRSVTTDEVVIECRDGSGQLERREIITTTTEDTTGTTYTVEDEVFYGNGQLRQRRTAVDEQNHGPFESYLENGQLVSKGTYNMGEKCGEWFEDGETETHPPPCPPGLEDGN